MDGDHVSPLGHLGVGVGSLLLSEGGHHVHKAPVVLDAALGAASLLFLLLLLFNLNNKTRGNAYFSEAMMPAYQFILKYLMYTQRKGMKPYLGCLSPHFSSTGQRAVNLTLMGGEGEKC